MKEVIKLKEGAPPEVLLAAQQINGMIELKLRHGIHFEIDPHSIPDRLVILNHTYDEDDEWCICDNYESGASSTIWDGKRWVYRSPWDGSDHEVPGGHTEVVHNWLCFFMG